MPGLEWALGGAAPLEAGLSSLCATPWGALPASGPAPSPSSEDARGSQLGCWRAAVGVCPLAPESTGRDTADRNLSLGTPRPAFDSA